MKALKILSLLLLVLLPTMGEEVPDSKPKPVADDKSGDPKEGEVAKETDDEDDDEESAKGDEPAKEVMVGRCNKALMESYDIESGWETVEDKNHLCPSILKLNCCSYHAQLDIFRKWVLKGEKKHILKTYRYPILILFI